MPAVRDGYQERVAFFHRYQQMDYCREILLTFGCWQYNDKEPVEPDHGKTGETCEYKDTCN